MGSGVRFEDYVAELLSRLGFRVMDRRVKVTSNGVEVGEVDLIAEDECGNKYSVEVKSGKVDVSGVRQAYTNARLINARPLIVARGFSNDSSRALAEELGVRVIELEDAIVLKPDELRTAVESAMYSLIEELADALTVLMSNRRGVEDVMDAITQCSDWNCVCGRLGLSGEECGRWISELRGELGLRVSSIRTLRAVVKLYRLLLGILRTNT
ncbi:YraN family protein [Caldivirga sp.]|uniref:YraN family protein n=1 Tax=Caldivirga sp. TaxID=2080243 RepID=UPI003D0CD384